MMMVMIIISLIQSLRAFRRAAFVVAGVGSDPSAGRLYGEFTDQLFTDPSCIRVLN